MLDPPTDERLGTVVAERYRVLERLAAGGMGVVYRAERINLGRIVAMKFLHSSFALNEDFLRRFEQEAQLMSRLSHPHCVSVIDFGVADSPFIVMEFVDGITLSEIVEDGGPLAPERAIRIVRQVLAGLAHAHEKGIVHRDVKPQNVMLTKATGTGDFSRILDFGLAKLRDADQTMASMVVGTPSYMSPEQASGRSVDGRTDVYSTGLLLFELLTGERAFFSEQAFELIRMHREDPPPTLAEMRPGVTFSDELEAAVRRALAKDPDERFPTPSAFAEALAEVPEELGQTPPRPAKARSPSAAEVAPTLAVAAVAEPKAVADTPPPAPAAAQPAVRPATTSPPPRPATTPPPGGRRIRRLVLLAGLVGGAAWLLLSTDWLDRGQRFVENKVAPRAERLARDAVGSDTPDAGAEKLPQTVDSAEKLARSGERERAIRMLHRILKRNPDSGRAPYLLGDLYFDKGWRSEALAAYAEAVDRDPGYRSRPELARRAIQLLGDPKVRDDARAFLVQRLGEAAVPPLERAARRGRSPAIRADAKHLVRLIRQRR